MVLGRPLPAFLMIADPIRYAHLQIALTVLRFLSGYFAAIVGIPVSVHTTFEFSFYLPLKLYTHDDQ